jgi:hypothetical protein
MLPRYPTSNKPVITVYSYKICPPDETTPLGGIMVPFLENTAFLTAKQLVDTFLNKNVHKFNSVYDFKDSSENVACWKCTSVPSIQPKMVFTICLYMRNGVPTAYVDNSYYVKNYELWIHTLDRFESYVNYDSDPVIRDDQDIADIYFGKW